MRLWQRILGVAAVAISAAALTPAALAASNPAISLDQSAGTGAGASHDLGLNLTFDDSGSDSPKTLTLQLPPGLLANAAQDGGACIRTPASSSQPSAACEVGSGTVTAAGSVSLVNAIPILPPVVTPFTLPVDVGFYLVAPPASGDLAGLEVYSSTLSEELGSPGDVYIRPSGDPDGVGATIRLTLPDTLNVTVAGQSFPATQVQIKTIASTLDNLRYPATCPAREPFTATATSYQDSAAQSVSAPLAVTGCSALAYAPKFSVSAVKDSSDKQTALTTTVTQGSTEAPNGSIALSFPTSLFAPNLRALSLLCLRQVSSCTTVGSVTAVSPLYPTPLTGQAYLTGSSSGLSLTLTFPQPFPLTLVGSVSLLTNTASFSGLPDIPLTSLSVKLTGGSKGLFATACRLSSGTATGRFVDQNNDQSRTVPAAFDVSGCSGSGASGSGGSGSGSGSGGSGSGSGSGWGGTSSTSSSSPNDWNGATHLSARPARGLRRGRPWMRFTVRVKRRAPKFTQLTVALPSGLRFRSHRVRRHSVVSGVAVTGARVRSLRLSHHRLVITLRRSTRSATVTLASRSMKESRGLRSLVEHTKVKRLKLAVAVRDTRHRTRKLTVTVRTDG